MLTLTHTQWSSSAHISQGDRTNKHRRAGNRVPGWLSDVMSLLSANTQVRDHSHNPYLWHSHWALRTDGQTRRTISHIVEVLKRCGNQITHNTTIKDVSNQHSQLCTSVLWFSFINNYVPMSHTQIKYLMSHTQMCICVCDWAMATGRLESVTEIKKIHTHTQTSVCAHKRQTDYMNEQAGGWRQQDFVTL